MKRGVRELAHQIAKDSIVTDAVARLIEQAIEEIHKTKIGPLKAEIAALKKGASLASIAAGAGTGAPQEGESRG